MNRSAEYLSTKAFEAALRELGTSQIRLEEVVRAYQQAFPHDALRPDMRRRLQGAILSLCERGVISIPDCDVVRCQDLELPSIVEMSASAQFITTPRDRLN